jgi:hypothetical protein
MEEKYRHEFRNEPKMRVDDRKKTMVGHLTSANQIRRVVVGVLIDTSM